MTAVEAPGAAAGFGRVRRDPAFWLFVAAVGLGGVQTAVLDVGARPLRAAVPYAVAALVVAVGLVRGVDRDEARGRRWLVGLAVVQVALAVWALQAFLRGLPAGIGEPSGFYRVKLLVTTPLGDHNTVAGLLLVGVVATVVLTRDDPRWWIGVAVTATGSVACLSRGAAVALVVVALASWVIGTRRRIAVALTAVALAILGAVSVLAVVLDASPPAGAHVPDGPIGTSVLGRVDLVVRGVEVFADHPVVGVGLGGFVEEAGDLPLPNDHAHNAFAHAAAEGGAPMLLLVVAVTVLLAWRALRQPRGWRREVTLLGGAALVAHAQVDVLGGLLGYELLLATLLAVATVVAPAGGRHVPGATMEGEP